ncbi:MAG TPA: DNRLRE domain-containing protein [Ignavibacteria bacterium]|nr:DNRLRE domain-containing protein [Ignavibacteria bacterium]
MLNQNKFKERVLSDSLLRISMVMILFLSAYSISNSQTIEITSSKDNTLYEDELGSFSNGAGQYFFTGETAGALLRRGVIAFDIAGNIPACATITSVTLTLHMSRTISGSSDVAMHTLLEDWGEGASSPGGQEGFGTIAEPGDATWIHNFYSSVLWDGGSQTGGVFSPTASVTQSVNGIGFYTWGSNSNMIQDVQSWLSNPSQNFGWILIGDERTLASAKRFDTKENLTPANRPKLTVTYVVNNIALNLTSFIQGFWNGTTMVSDTARVYLANSVSPYNVLYTSVGVLGTNGNKTFCFPNAPTGSYYIVVDHRNSINTWSNLPQSFITGVTKVYDFSNDPAKAYGNNEVLISGKYCIYGADVNKDGTVDASDIGSIENDATNSVSGYVQTDVTGDDFVDSADISIVENNATNSVVEVSP